MPIGDQLSDAELHRCYPRRQAPQAPVVLRLVGQIGEESRQQASDRPQELAVETKPVTAWATASAISSSSVTLPAGPVRGIDSEQANT